MFPYYKSWMIFGSTFMYEIKFHGYCLFHPEYGWKFMHWRFMNDIARMFIHKIWIFFAQLFCKFTLPTSQFHFAKWWSLGYYLATVFCQINFSRLQVHFAKSQSQQCPIVKSMVPSQHSQATNSTPPRQHRQIVNSKFAFWTAHTIKKLWVVQCLIFSGLLKLLPKTIRPFQNSNYPLN